MVNLTLTNFYISSDQNSGEEHILDELHKEGCKKIVEELKSVLITEASGTQEDVSKQFKEQQDVMMADFTIQDASKADFTMQDATIAMAEIS